MTIIPTSIVLPINGVLTKGSKKSTNKHSFKEGERGFHKKTLQILVGVRCQKKEFAIVSLDDSFFFYDSLVKRVWIEDTKRPVVKITGSHKH